MTLDRVCTVCGRTSSDGNMWCQEADCPAEDKPFVYSYGDIVGDVKVIRLRQVLRNAAIYEGQRGGDQAEEKQVFLKVAHNGAEALMEREAKLLSSIAGSRDRGRFQQFPRLLPAYEPSTIKQHPLGRTIVSGEEQFFEVFEYEEGHFLRDRLLENPQPWYQHAAWIALSLTEALGYLNMQAKRLNVMLSPETILVREDLAGVPRPLLLDLGFLITETHPEHLRWLHEQGLPAYTAPELTYTKEENISKCQPATPATEVYGVGLVLYEMLAGRPVYPFRNRRDAEVQHAVRNQRPAAMGRSDLPESVHALVHRAINRNPEDRHSNVIELGRELRQQFGRVPREKKPSSKTRRLYVGVATAAALFSLLILLAAFLGG